MSQFAAQRVMRWHALLEECGPTFVFEKGSENCIAGAWSQAPTENENVKPAMPETQCVKVNDLWTECPWAMPKFDEQNHHPFQFETMKHYQSLNNNVLNLPCINPDKFSFQMFRSHKFAWCTRGDQHHIVLADAVLPHLVTWCHHLTTHAEGMVWLETSMQCHFWHGNPHGKFWNQLSACDICSKMKKNSPKEGQLAPCNVPSVPWLEAHIDLIGPWKLKS